MDFPSLVYNFRDFLNLSWSAIDKISFLIDWDDDPYFIDCWLQSNWELLVERLFLPKGQSLRPYGYNQSPNSRRSVSAVPATHIALYRLKSDPRMVFIFSCLVTEDTTGSTTALSPPFDLVSGKEIGTNRVVNHSLDKVELLVVSEEEFKAAHNPHS